MQVSLASEPSEATVLVDGASVGRTPWVGSLAINEGTHQALELQLEGYRSQAVDLAVEDGQAAQTVRLEPVPRPAPKPAVRVPDTLPPQTRPPQAAPPAPAPAPRTQPEPTPSTAPPAPAPAPAPAPPPPSTTVEGVAFAAAQVTHTLEMANAGTKADFNAAGIRTQEFNRVQAGRPFASLSAVAAAPGVGPKTLQRMRDSMP